MISDDVSVSEFRTLFPMFTEEYYSEQTVELWLKIAQSFVNKCAWKELYKFGVYLLTAHFLALNVRDPNSASSGNNGTGGVGVTTSGSKTVGKVSKSFGKDLSSVSLSNQGQFGYTIWGQEFFYYLRLLGSGAVSWL